ncbi:hypothetical protein ABZ807_03470 [Micromonospora sp. NPDC047548]|uniref:hypothetical protein n=1 Tax=Micromonospora sp. NPDC047548 TaxID=3155624 RepID=UPI0033C4699D
MPGLTLPAYFSYYKSPVKIVPTPEGGLAAWRLSIDTGGWELEVDIVDEILFARGGEISTLTVDQFVQRTESQRARYLGGTGPIFALYETVQAIEEAAGAEGRRLAAHEIALISGIRRKTFRMFEEQLRAAGDEGADPSLAG